MLDFHIRNGADATIAVREVPWDEASRFGIMNTDSEGKIVEFEEKPKNPKSNKASMGVYIFTWEKLRHYLTEDEADKKSSNDFGKNIIPNMLGDKQVLYAYDFVGYWKDVGTIESLWEANMDLLESPMPIDMHDKKWRIPRQNRYVHCILSFMKLNANDFDAMQMGWQNKGRNQFGTYC